MSEKERDRDEAVISEYIIFSTIGPLNNEMQNLIDRPFDTPEGSGLPVFTYV